MALIEFNDQFWEPQHVEDNTIWISPEFKINKEAYSWFVSGLTKPHTVRIYELPFDLIHIDDSLLDSFLEHLKITPDTQFWEDRLEEHYGKKFRNARPSGISAEQQYRELSRIQKVLNSPLFNRNYSDLETVLPLETITQNDRIDLLMLLPLNLIRKYENLKYRLTRDQKRNVLIWLHCIDPSL